jgi:hypothetical protein
MVVYICNSGTQEAKAEGSRVERLACGYITSSTQFGIQSENLLQTIKKKITRKQTKK